MSSTENDKTVPVYTRLPQDMAERLEEAAASNDRTVAAEMRRAVRLYLEPQGVSAAA
jgi:hypothetical protein